MNNLPLAGAVNTKKSGQKLSTQKWLNIYLRKVLLNSEECDPRIQPEPIVDQRTGQKFPPPHKQMPNYGKFWKYVFDERANPGLAGLNKKIKVDWDRWQDEDQEKDMQEEFDPEKLIELMKKNGEWSDEEEGAGLEDQLAQEGEEEKEEEDENGRAKDIVDQPGDDHMFEQFLRSGDYAIEGLPQKRARQVNIQENPEDLEDDGEFAFKDFALRSGELTHKRTKTESQFQDFMQFLKEQDLNQGPPQFDDE